MPNIFHSINNFTSGQLSENLAARFDIKEYANGAALLRNQFAKGQGGTSRRPGTRFVVDSSAIGAGHRVIPFTIRSEQFLLTIETDAAAAHFLILDADGNSETIGNVLGTAYNGLTKEGWSYVVDTIFDIDVLILVHISGNVPPVVIGDFRATTLQFTIMPWFDGDPSWGTAFFNPLLDSNFLRFPYDNRNRSATTITPSGVSGAITLTSSSALFALTDVGSYVRLTHAAVTSLVLITGFTNSTTVSGTVDAIVNTTAAATAAWEFMSWSDTNGWPRKVVQHNQRTIFLSTAKYPNRVFNSFHLNSLFFMDTVLDQDASTDVSGLLYFGAVTNSDPFVYDIKTSNQGMRNVIQWASSGDGLEIGTDSRELVATGKDGPYGPLFIDVDTKTRYGGGDIASVNAGENTYYVSRDGKNVREFGFSQENGSFRNRNLSRLASDIVYKGSSDLSAFSSVIFKELVWQGSRNILWCLTSAGGLVGITIEPETGVLAWHEHEIAGADEIHGIGVLSSQDNETDELYMCVERTINAATVFYIEKIGLDFDADSYLLTFATDNDFPWFMDSAVRVTQASSKTVTGLGHLQGETVVVIANGVVETGKVVTAGGEITLDTAATEIIVGLNYFSDIKSMPLIFSGPEGQGPMLRKDANRARIRLYKSQGGIYGQDEDTLDSSFEYDVDDLFTGELEYNPDLTPDQELRYYLRQDQPFPFNVNGVFFEGSAHGVK